MTNSSDDILYLSQADVSAVEVEPEAVIDALAQAFQSLASGKLVAAPKTSLWMGPGNGFQVLSIVDSEHEVAVAKWIGLVPPGPHTRTNVNATLLLSDTLTGSVRCIMDAQRATALRTAGMSALAARHLARSDSRDLGFIGAGVQAHGHLSAFVKSNPGLSSAWIHSVNEADAARLAQSAEALGLNASVVTADQVVARSDILVSTVPLYQGFTPFLDAAMTKPGAFIASIDLGRPWIDTSLSALDLTVIDDEAMRTACKPGDFIPSLENADATLADLVIGKHVGRATSAERTIYISSGSALADCAIGRLIYEKATAASIGQLIPR